MPPELVHFARPETALAPVGTALYVHLPYCAVKCTYCDFYSVPGAGEDLDSTLEWLAREAEQRAPRSPRTVFLGGGTPTYFDCEQLRRFLDALEHYTGFRESAVEVTVECNPESLDEEKARCLLELGATRFSIGFQSLDARVLELFGRPHSVEQSFQAYEAARRAGAQRISIDLIYAHPLHDPAVWERELERVLALRPEHLSAYNLTFEEETPFHRWLEQGRVQRLPEERELELFWLTRELLARRGFGAYEISNYCLSGQQCAHNLNYWLNGDYVGIGPSAASHLGAERWGNARSIGAWKRELAAPRANPAWHERLESPARRAESWWLGLRLAQGVDPACLPLADARTLEAEHALIAELAGHGLIELAGSSWSLTRQGLPLADAVARRFLALPATTDARNTV